MSSISTIEVFISYAEADEEFYQPLENHLSTLRRMGAIETWNKQKVIAGQKTQDEIDQHLKQAGIILLLVSANFLASDYLWNNNMTRAMEQHNAGKACVIPILLRSVDYEGAPFAKIRIIPRNTKDEVIPVVSTGTDKTDIDNAFTQISQEIRKAVQKLVAKSSYASPEDLTPKQEQQQDQVTKLITAANILREESKLKEAIAKLDAVIRLDPCNVYAYLCRGTARNDLGDTNGAIEDYTKAVQINPNDAIAYVKAYAFQAMAMARNTLGDTDGAIEDYDNYDKAYST